MAANRCEYHLCTDCPESGISSELSARRHQLGAVLRLKSYSFHSVDLLFKSYFRFLMFISETGISAETETEQIESRDMMMIMTCDSGESSTAGRS